MTEAEWLACESPILLLGFLGEKLSERQVRLIACACSRRVWTRFRGAERVAVEVGERFADGEATEAERNQASKAALAVRGFGWMRAACCDQNDHLRRLLPRLLSWADSVERLDESRGAVVSPSPQAVQARIIRDIVGSPFRVPAQVRRSAELTGLAQATYEDRVSAARVLDPVRLSILADALEDAGCDDDGILAHCRYGGTHVRGCWVVDLLLDKS